MASKTKSVLISVVVLRLLTLGFLAASIVLLFLDKFTFSDATGVIGFLYTFVQNPFAIYHASKASKKWMSFRIIAFLLATGAGAGFAVTFEFKKLLKDFIKSVGATFGFSGLDETDSITEKFLDKANVATGLLFLGFICMAILSVFSSIVITIRPIQGSSQAKLCLIWYNILLT
ncbi:CASP-like protein 4D1 [Mangifera indica]|uniref:CASP-like protein 4D1 n=1 Tax=Mangifera indica TaxID=29780 RepID=UPI001CFA1D6A|nr:CASP-like protein 4D1 [Mangifera indica]